MDDMSKKILGEMLQSLGGTRGANINVSIDVTPEDVIHGVDKQISFHCAQPCPHCKGTGGDPITTAKRCRACNGEGNTTRVQREQNNKRYEMKPCQKCNGRGKIYPKVCPTCAGRGSILDKRQGMVTVPPGTKEGTVLRKTALGHKLAVDATPGDVLVTIHIRHI